MGKWTNNESIGLFLFFFSKKKKPLNIKFFLKFKSKSDLIVNFNNKDSIYINNLIKESYNAYIPVISFDVNKYFNIFKPTYVLCNTINLDINFFFFTVLKSIFKKKVFSQKNSYIFDKTFFTRKKTYTKKFYNKKRNKKFDNNNNNRKKFYYNKNKHN